MSQENRVAGRALELREEFDRTFARAQRAQSPDDVDFLAIRVATVPYALALAEIVGLHSEKPITPLPTRVRGLLGIVGFRGNDLGGL